VVVNRDLVSEAQTGSSVDEDTAAYHLPVPSAESMVHFNGRSSGGCRPLHPYQALRRRFAKEVHEGRVTKIGCALTADIPERS